MSINPSRRAKDEELSYAEVLYTIGTLRPPSTANPIASITWGTTCSGVTKLMLWHLVSFWSFNIRSAISSPFNSHPFFCWLMSQFWQKTHLRLHIPKKIVPDPFQPCNTDSSPKWGNAELTMAFLPVLQAPLLSSSRSTLQSLPWFKYNQLALKL